MGDLYYNINKDKLLMLEKEVLDTIPQEYQELVNPLTLEKLGCYILYFVDNLVITNIREKLCEIQ